MNDGSKSGSVSRSKEFASMAIMNDYSAWIWVGMCDERQSKKDRSCHTMPSLECRVEE